MSLRRKQDDVRLLSFDPFQTEPENGFKSRFEWEINHRMQTAPDWCWAACLSNALNCVGVYVNQDEIVDMFRTELGGPPDATDQRIPTPKHVVDLWRSYGFYRARPRRGVLPVEDLVKEIVANGPLQIELWRQGAEGARHLALIFGLREDANGIEIGVSDPLAMEPVWRRYEVLVGSDPLPSGFGEWRRTYTGLGYQKGYLRRFYGRPSQFLAGLPDEEIAKDVPVPEVPLVESRLGLEQPPYSYPPLAKELTLAAYGYRHYRYRTAPKHKKEARKADLLQPLFLFESIPIWRPPYVIDYKSPLCGQLRFYRWHHQIHDASGPRYYAEAWFFEELREQLDRAWRTTWIGERWKAQRVDDAIRKLDADAEIQKLDADADVEDSEEIVCMVQFRRHGLVTLFLPKSEIHMIVSAHTERQATFPLQATFTDKELRETLERLLSAPAVA